MGHFAYDKVFSGLMVNLLSVQLWTVNNYHWYLKQNLSFNVTASDKVVAILWDPECACRLHILYSGGHYIQYTWSWTTNHSRGLTTEDTATVAVIDGGQCFG